MAINSKISFWTFWTKNPGSSHSAEGNTGYLSLAFVAFKGRNWAGGEIQQFKVPASSSSGIAAVGITKFGDLFCNSGLF